MSSDVSQGWMIVRTILSLGAVVGLILALSWLAKKYLQPHKWGSLAGNSSGMKIKSSFALEPRKRLLVVEIENQRLLLGVAENSISYLCSLNKSFGEKQLGEKEIPYDDPAHHENRI